MTVLDASAVLALVHNEPGSDLVADELAGAFSALPIWLKSWAN